MNILLNTFDFHKPYVFPYLSSIIKKEANVLIIPWGFDETKIRDKETFEKAYDLETNDDCEKLFTCLKVYGINKEQVTVLPYYEEQTEQLKEQISGNDILVLLPGFPEKYMGRFREKKLIPILESFPGVKIGIETGALILSGTFFLSPNEDYDRFCIGKGLKADLSFGISIDYLAAPEQIVCMEHYQKMTGHDVYTLEKESGILVKESALMLVGNARKYAGRYSPRTVNA